MFNNSGLFRRKPPKQASRPRWVYYATTSFLLGLVILYLRHMSRRLAAVQLGGPSSDGGTEGPFLRAATQLPATAATDRTTAPRGEPNPGVGSGLSSAMAPANAAAAALGGRDPYEEEHQYNREHEPQPLGGYEQDEKDVGPDHPQPPPPRALSAPGDRGGDDTTAAAPAVAAAAALDVGTATIPPPPPQKYRALIFTMDSISDYVTNSKAGGPAGEIIIRQSLEWALQQLGVEPVVATSDAEFATLSSTPDSFDLYFLDPWTYVSPGWKPRAFLPGREARSFCLSFFGMSRVEHGWAIPLSHVLIPFPFTQMNSFLGYAMEPRWLPRGPAAVAAGAVAPWPRPLPVRKRQGVIWGKRAQYFEGKLPLLTAIAAEVELHTTAVGLGGIEGIVSHGHLTVDEWHTLLAESRFMIGLGDPLIGPSALDAVAAGAVFINPTFPAKKLDFFDSQHPYLASALGAPYVCNAALEDTAAVMGCVRKAMDLDLPPLIPPDMTREAYLERARRLLEPALQG